jgi:hypothetical protein
MLTFVHHLVTYPSHATTGVICLYSSGPPSDAVRNSLLEFVTGLPKTRSGKIMRRILKAREMGIDPGDLTTIEVKMIEDDLVNSVNVRRFLSSEPGRASPFEGEG